jgi:hypothetical protein
MVRGNALSSELRKIAGTVVAGLILAAILALFNLANRVTALEVSQKYLHGENVLKEAK